MTQNVWSSPTRADGTDATTLEEADCWGKYGCWLTRLDRRLSSLGRVIRVFNQEVLMTTSVCIVSSTSE